MSLSELKAQNAQAESTEVEEEVEQPEVAEVEEVEVVEPEKSEETIDTEQPEVTEESEPVHIEDWMKPDDEESESEGFKPNSVAAALRRKSKEKLAKKDEEIEALRAKVEALEKSSSQATVEQLPPRPKLEDFDYDESRHEAALDEWYDKKAESKVKQTLSTTQQEQQQKEAAERQRKAVESALDSHYNAAAKLIDSGLMTEDQYSNAEGVLTRDIDSVFPGQGEQFVSSIIATLNEVGEGSEKVTYTLGVNKTKREKLINMLRVNPGSPAVAAYLGQLSAQASTPAKRKSSAPAPATQTSAGGKGKAETLYQTYKKMPAGPERVSFKRKAKRDGADVSKW